MLQADALIIGSGLAGLMCALKMSRSLRVILLSKSSLSQSNSYLAQGGIAAVVSDFDSFEQHIQDTLKAGDGLCHKDIVREVIEAGPRVIEELAEFGVMFSRDEEEERDYHLTKEGGHSCKRILHACDRTGQAIVSAIVAKLRNHPQVTILDGHMVVDLITTDKIRPSFDGNVCLGAYVMDLASEKIFSCIATHTFLCTGGHGRAYLYTSNPSVSTGDGVAMAWRAGAKVANLEFMQFHPTCLYHNKKKDMLISEALRGEGAVLVNRKGEDYTLAYHPQASLAPRDVVARATYNDLKQSGDNHVYLDISKVSLKKFQTQFRHIAKVCESLGILVTQGDAIPVVPCAHYSCGGVVVNACGETSLAGLYAVGEVACTGLHGGNRLASNSLLEVMVFSEKVCEYVIQKHRPSMDMGDIPAWDYGHAIALDERGVLNHTWDEIRRIMWNYVGIVRTTKRLKRAMDKISAIRTELDEYYWDTQPSGHLLEVRNLSLVAYLTIMCALKRKESRGSHYTTDYPNKHTLAKDTIL